MKNKQTLLNKELTRYFNTIIHDIKHPERIGLKPNSKSFQNIKSLHYNQSTETLYIEMKFIRESLNKMIFSLYFRIAYFHFNIRIIIYKFHFI